MFVAPCVSAGIKSADKVMKPRQGRKRFNREFLSPLAGLLNVVLHLIPRLTPWAIKIPPLAGLQPFTLYSLPLYPFSYGVTSAPMSMLYFLIFE